MSDAVAVALISGGLALLGVIITSISTSRRMTAQLERNQAVTDTKIEELTREVRLHNNFAQRIPVIERDIKVINHRIDDLEKITKECKKYENQHQAEVQKQDVRDIADHAYIGDDLSNPRYVRYRT